MPAFDIDAQNRLGTWDSGADEFDGTTAVKLASFAARGLDASVLVEWQTASELSNLGFDLYRGSSPVGPWARLNSSLIPGLGSSPEGRRYTWLDAGLSNGTLYYYRLEDVDASSVRTAHGPVSAVPEAGGGDGAEPATSASGKRKRGSSASCPDWVVAAYGSATGSESSSPLRCTRHGDPEAVSLEVLSRDSRQATLELRTGGFYALHDPSGGVRVFVPGFDFPQDARGAALPLRRALVDAVVGRRVQLGGVRALEQVGFRGLVPAALGSAEMQVSWDGTVRAGRTGAACDGRAAPGGGRSGAPAAERLPGRDEERRRRDHAAALRRAAPPAAAGEAGAGAAAVHRARGRRERPRQAGPRAAPAPARAVG